MQTPGEGPWARRAMPDNGGHVIDAQDARARNVKVTWTALPMGFKNDE